MTPAFSFPSVSLVVPTFRRPKRLASCLESLAALDYPGELLEVVVVEDGGPTGALDPLRERDFNGLRVVWADQPHRGPAVARNRGARLASNELLAFTDDDCRPRSDWLIEFARELSRRPRSVVGGQTINALTDNAYSRASQALVTYMVKCGQGKEQQFFASNNFALSRNLFEEVGGFAETFPCAGGEDRELCDRLVQQGIQLTHVPKAVIDHDHFLTARTFWRQHFGYGRGAYHYHLTHSARRDTTQARDLAHRLTTFDARFYVDLLRYPFGADEDRPVTTSMLLLLSQLPNTLGYFGEWLRDRRAPHEPKRSAANERERVNSS
jgi:GT2 family glycosyltransferase